MFSYLFMTGLFITNTKDRPCISSPVDKPPPPPLYKPIKNRLRKYISPGLIVGGLRYCTTHLHPLFSFAIVSTEFIVHPWVVSLRPVINVRFWIWTMFLYLPHGHQSKEWCMLPSLLSPFPRGVLLYGRLYSPRFLANTGGRKRLRLVITKNWKDTL